MIDRADEQVLGYLLGALDDCEREGLEFRLQCDPAYQRKLAVMWRQFQAVLALRPQSEPPAGLAERTCGRVFAHARNVRARAMGHRRLRTYAVQPGSRPHVRRLDVIATALVGIFFFLLLLPALHGNRLQARAAACQDNLREAGLALAHYDAGQGNSLSPSSDPQLMAAKLYAPLLVQAGLDARRVEHREQLPVAFADQRFTGMYSARSARCPESWKLRLRGHLAERDEYIALFVDGHVAFAAWTQPAAGGDDNLIDDSDPADGDSRPDDAAGSIGLVPVVP
jgi:hypothetical protein